MADDTIDPNEGASRDVIREYIRRPLSGSLPASELPPTVAPGEVTGISWILENVRHSIPSPPLRDRIKLARELRRRNFTTYPSITFDTGDLLAAQQHAALESEAGTNADRDWRWADWADFHLSEQRGLRDADTGLSGSEDDQYIAVQDSHGELKTVDGGRRITFESGHQGTTSVSIETSDSQFARHSLDDEPTEFETWTVDYDRLNPGNPTVLSLVDAQGNKLQLHHRGAEFQQQTPTSWNTLQTRVALDVARRTTLGQTPSAGIADGVDTGL